MPLLGVLPGTGGLTRLVDKRKVRRDLADVFSSLAEGIKGKRAVEWGLVDETAPLSRFAARVAGEGARRWRRRRPPRSRARRRAAAARGEVRADDGVAHRYVIADARRGRAHGASSPCAGPTAASRRRRAALRARGSELWALRAFRELDDALLDLRFNRPEIGVVVLKTEGDAARGARRRRRRWSTNRDDWFAREVLHHMKRVLKRLDLTARSFFAVVDPGSCFAGSLLELALAADRVLHAGRARAGPRSRSRR